MMHAGPGMPMMQISGAGFAVGLVAWALSAAITGGLIAVIYNAMTGKQSA
jgi:hypothetical protein